MLGHHYGIWSTGGKRGKSEDLKQLQRYLLLSHSVGVGNPVPKEISRLMLQLKVHALSLGFSGISLETLDRLLQFLDLDLIPVIPEKAALEHQAISPLLPICCCR